MTRGSLGHKVGALQYKNRLGVDDILHQYKEQDEVLYRDHEYFHHLEEKRNSILALQSSQFLPISSNESNVEELPIKVDMTNPLEEDEVKSPGPLVPCKICSRTFAKDRLAKHMEICKSTAKPRPVFNVAMARIAGTEAEELVTSGRMALEPAKPFEKKTEMTKKITSQPAPGTKLPPMTAAPSKPPPKLQPNISETKNGAAYQVVFDQSNRMKTGKPMVGIGRGLPTQKIREDSNELRRLSAKNWKKAKNKVNPDLNSSSGASNFSDDDYDFLAASMTSQKTVCSDAFDFLFDETNMNPEKVLENEFNTTKTEFRQNYPVTPDTRTGSADLKKKKEDCCVIS